MDIVQALLLLIHICATMYFSLILIGGIIMNKKFAEVKDFSYWKYYGIFATVSLLFYYSSLFKLDLQFVMLTPVFAYTQFIICYMCLDAYQKDLIRVESVKLKTLYSQLAVALLFAITYATPVLNFVIS